MSARVRDSLAPLRPGLSLLVLGLIGAAVVRIAAGDLRVVATVSLTGLVVVLAVVASAALTTILALRRRRLARTAVAVRQAHESSDAAAHDERRRFLLRLDHELKNPLMAISAGLANLTEPLAPGRTSQDAAMDSVRAQVDRLARLLGDLRKLSELETRPLELEDVDLAALLTEVVEVVEDTADARREVRLTLPSAPWPLPRVSGDRDLLFLAAANLVANAVKYSDDGDTIEVRAAHAGDQVRIEVADTGRGIAEDEVEEVWSSLVRGRSAAGTSGSGLGLAFVRTVVERHHGTVEILSRAGDGTAVAVHLPVAPPVRDDRITPR